MLLAEFLYAREIFRLSVVVPGFGAAARRKRVILGQVRQHLAAMFKQVSIDMSPDRLFAAVQSSRGLVSGSGVLHCLEGREARHEARRWRPRDLDVFVPSHRSAKKFLKFLEGLGCAWSVSTRAKRKQNYPSAFEVHTMELRESPSTWLYVQVIVVDCKPKNLDEHVAGFDLSFLRNWTNGRKLVIGDTSAVCKRRSRVSRWPTGRPHKFLRWLDTYSRRGYGFSNLRMQPKLAQVDGVQVRVFLMMLDRRCVGVYFKRNSLLENMHKLGEGEDEHVIYACKHSTCLFRDFVLVSTIITWQGAPLELVSRLRKLAAIKP
jgi:hypothetical protein